jgi:FKBP-type peptidyl-prolyl cis-trans isomerase FkpA
MKRKLMFLAFAAIGLASCNGGFKKGDGGLLYDIIVDKPGPSIKPGDFISINFIIKNDADSVLASSYDMGHQAPQLIPKSQKKGDIFSGLAMLSEGDSAVLKVNIDSVSKGMPRQKNMKGKYVVYVIKVEKVIAKGNLSDQVFAGRYQAFLKSMADEAKKEEPIKIKKYIADNNLKVTTTPTGLNYVITTPGSGPKPMPGDTVVVNYTGKFLNGKIFDTSIKSEAQKGKLAINPMNPYKPIRFPLGVQGMIPGWNEGLLLFNKGTKATMILPSNDAYGEQGYQQIQPFTSLVFEIELVDIIHPNPNAPKPVAPVMPGQPQAQPQPVTK